MHPRRPSVIMKPKLVFSFAFCCAHLLGGMGNAEAQQAGIGLVELRQLAGAENVDGSGVNLLQVEAGTFVRNENGDIIGIHYSPENPGELLIGSKNFEDIGTFQSLGNNQGHARGVAVEIYGELASRTPINQFGTAPAIGSPGNPSIKILSFSDLFINRLGDDNRTPVAHNFDVSNHSYVFTLSPSNGFDEAAAVDILRRMDFVINNGNMATVVGSSNSSDNPLPAGFVQAYNTINVGVSDGTHGFGPTTLNVPGRNSIHITAPRGTTSGATAHVSAAVSLLHQTGAGTDAVKHEVIKATVLAGATKDDLTDADDVPITWSHTQTQPLDNRYGAGELNVLNNYHIQQGGEVDGGETSATAATADFNGWDYEDVLSANSERFYQFTVGTGEAVEDFSIALAWNLEVVDGVSFPFLFRADANELANLSLQVTDLSDNTVVDLSDSSIDNVEHIFLPTLSAGTYQLRVANSSAAVATDYGLAFRGTVVDAALLGDCNLDGVVDFLDVNPLIGFLTSGVYLVQADCNQDGVVNFLDVGPFITILTSD